jgi:hypothetical protein
MENLKEFEAAYLDEIRAIRPSYIGNWLSKPAAPRVGLRISGGRIKMILFVFLVAVLEGAQTPSITTSERICALGANGWRLTLEARQE